MENKAQTDEVFFASFFFRKKKTLPYAITRLSGIFCPTSRRYFAAPG